MSLHPKVIDLTLDRMWRLLRALGHPEQALPPVVHVAGTNGKGSTLAMIRAGIEGAGQSAHVYTSPHIARFHERIRLAGTLISEDALTQVLDACLAKNGPDPITYFEITTAAALLAFARSAADWTLLEVGLGGRLDATNVIDKPALTIITPVDLDHQQFLGETLEDIAGEKAGILKPGTPCIVGPQHERALEVIRAQAERVGAPLLVHGQDWLAWEERGRMVYQDQSGLLDLPRPNLIGAHQIGNAGMALAALRQMGLPEASYETAVTQAEWPARMQRLKDGGWAERVNPAELWLDGGHNPAAGAALSAALDTLPPRPLHIVCGMLKTKDIAGYLRHFVDRAETLTAISIPGETATLSAEETALAARAVGLTAQAAPDLGTALDQIIAHDPNVRILICGSLYLAGHVLRENGT